MRSVLAIIAVSSTLLTADPQAREPTRWQILLRIPKHPVFDDAFQSSLKRELTAALQPGLGLLGAVDVLDTSDFADKGWPALDAFKTLDGVKRHGLAIECRDGSYVLSARQYDAFTGLATPLLRTRTVRSLDQIPRAAAMLLEPDYAPAGTVTIIPNDAKHVMVELRGHALAPMESRVKLSDVFAVSLIRDATTTTPLPFTLLKVVEGVKSGTCKCVILSRLANPFTRDYRKALAIRALKLPTVNAPLKLQLVDKAGKPHLRPSDLNLFASDIDFTASPTDSDRFEYRDGLFRSKRSFASVACISVGVGQDAVQRFPAAIVSDDVITLAFDVDRAAVLRAEFLRDCVELRARIADLSTAQIAMVTSMNALLDIAKNREALARAETGRDTVGGLVKSLSEELKTLAEQPGARDGTAKEVLDAGARALIAIRSGQTQLEATIISLKEIAAKPNDAKIEIEIRGQMLADRIKECLGRGDIPETLDAYDKLIALYPNDALHKDAREKLKAQWVPKDDAHRAARESLRLLAAAKSADDFKTAIDAVKKAVPILVNRKDRLGLHKLSLTFKPALDAMQTLTTATDGVGLTPEKLEEVRRLDEIMVDLRQCVVLVTEELKKLPR